MNINQRYIQKNGMVIMRIARELMTAKDGDRLPSIKEYTERFETARGTVQTAIKTLLNNGCITLLRRGNNGTFIISINHDRIWEHTGWSSLTGAMPLPGSQSLSGLATGVGEVMKSQNIPFNFAFMQGAKNRLNALERYIYDFVIVSEITADVYSENFTNIEIAMKLDNCIYTKNYQLMFTKPGDEHIHDGMTIAVDQSSIDQKYLMDIITKGYDVNVLDIQYMSSTNSVLDGRADATIIHSELVSTLDTRLKSKVIEVEGFSNSKGVEAVILINKENFGMKELLQKKLNSATIADIQNMVVEKKMTFKFY